MVEALVLWNEPNNLSHWNFHLDPEWKRFSEMVKLASTAIRKINPYVPIVLGGVSSCDCDFLRLLASYGVMDHVDAVGVHGFPRRSAIPQASFSAARKLSARATPLPAISKPVP